eukprot:PhM_4_TR3572/c0_g1_i1/m.75470
MWATREREPIARQGRRRRCRGRAGCGGNGRVHRRSDTTAGEHRQVLRPAVARGHRHAADRDARVAVPKQLAQQQPHLPHGLVELQRLHGTLYARELPFPHNDGHALGVAKSQLAPRQGKRRRDGSGGAEQVEAAVVQAQDADNLPRAQINAKLVPHVHRRRAVDLEYLLKAAAACVRLPIHVHRVSLRALAQGSGERLPGLAGCLARCVRHGLDVALERGHGDALDVDHLPDTAALCDVVPQRAPHVAVPGVGHHGLDEAVHSCVRLSIDEDGVARRSPIEVPRQVVPRPGAVGVDLRGTDVAIRRPNDAHAVDVHRRVRSERLSEAQPRPVEVGFLDRHLQKCDWGRHDRQGIADAQRHRACGAHGDAKRTPQLPRVLSQPHALGGQSVALLLQVITHIFKVIAAGLCLQRFLHECLAV